MQRLRMPPQLIQLAESTGVAPGKVQILKVGDYHHPEYGLLKITPDTLFSMKRNFDNKVRGIDCAVDYSHESESIAAGWFHSLELADDGQSLWGSIKWTPNGERVVREKEFRYLSADFNFSYKDNQTLQEFGPTLLGAGLTNRPFIKGMEPTVELTEGKGSQMKTVEQLQAEVTKLTDENKKLSEQSTAFSTILGGMTPEQMMEKMKGLETQCAQLTEENKKLKEGQQSAAQAAALAEKKGKFDKLLSEGKVVEAQRQAFMDGDAVKLAELGEKVQLTPQGGQGNPPAQTVDAKDRAEAETELQRQARAILAEKPKTSVREAYNIVLADPKNKKLRELYEAGTPKLD